MYTHSYWLINLELDYKVLFSGLPGFEIKLFVEILWEWSALQSASKPRFLNCACEKKKYIFLPCIIYGRSIIQIPRIKRILSRVYLDSHYICPQ